MREMKKHGETSPAWGRRRRIILLFAVLIMLASAAAPALGEGQPERPPGPDYDPALDEMTPAELLDRSRMTPSGSERASIRGYLARVHPERAEGIAAQAWIVSRDDNFERSAELYRRALELDPTISVVRNNLAYVLGRLGRYEEQVAVRERQLALDPEYGQYQPFVWNYFNYRQRLGGEPAAERYRARLEDQLGESHFVLTQIDAIEAIDAGDHERALELRRRRIAEGDPPYWFREDYALHEYRQRNQNAQNVGERLTPLAELSTWAHHYSSEKNSHRALMLSAERLAEDFEAYADALSLYVDAFDAYPAAEALDDAFGFSRSRDREESLSFLEDALNTLPYSPLVRRIEAWNYMNFDFDPERAERAARRALELSATPQERRLSVERLANVYEYTMLDYDRAHEVLTDNAESYADDRARHLVELYENRLEAQDFAQAAAYLERRGELGDLDRSWYQESRLRVGRLLDSTQERTPDAEIVLSGSFEGDPMAISPDGSLAAVGFYPMQLWDIESGQKVRDLGRGGPTRRFSPDGRYVASISNYNVASGRVESALYVYDVQRGDLLFVLPSLAYDLRDFAWSPDSTRIAFGDRTGQIRVYDVPSGMPAGVFRASDVRIAPRLTWLPNGEIAIAQAQAETIRLFDGDSYEFLRDLPGVRWPHTITHTAGGTYLVVTDDNYRLHVWDTESWTRRSGRIPVFARRIAAHPERPYIAVNDAGNNSVQFAVYDVATMQVVGVRTGRERVRPGFAGDRLAIGDGASVQFYSLPDLAPAGRLQSFSSNGSGTILETGSGYALTQDEAGTHFFDLESGRHDATVDISASFTDLGNGNLLYFEDGGARVFSTRSFEVAREFDIGVAVDQVAIGNDVLAIGGTPLGDDTERAETAVVEVYSRDDFSLEYSISFPFATEYVRRSVFEPRIRSLDVSGDGELLAIATEWRDGFGRAVTTTKDARVFDASGTQVGSVSWDDNDVDAVEFSPRAEEELVVRFGGVRRRYDWRSGRFRSFEGYYDGSTITLSDGRVLEWTAGSFSIGERTVFNADFISSLEVDEERNIIVVLTRQNQLILYALDTLEEIIRIHRKRDNQWIAVAPTGEYAASVSGADGANWNVDGRLLALAHTSRLMDNPDLLTERLEAARRRQAPAPTDFPATVANAMRIGEDVSLSLELSSAAESSPETVTARTTIGGSLSAAADVAVEFSVNGELLHTIRGRSNDVIERAREVELGVAPGEHSVVVRLVVDDVVLIEEEREVSVEVP